MSPYRTSDASKPTVPRVRSRSDEERPPRPVSRRASTASSSTSPSGYAIEKPFSVAVIVPSWTYGAAKNTQTTRPRPVVTINASRRA